MSIVFVDTETTGLNPFIHEVISVGYVIETDGEIVKEVEFSVPFDVDKADPKALEVNGWGTRHFPEQITVEEAALKIVDDWDSLAIMASPTHFDLGFILALLTKAGRTPSWSHRQVVDFRSFYLGTWFREADYSALGLRDLSERLEVPMPSDRHGALVDAKWLREMYRKALR